MFNKIKFSQILNEINNTYDTMTEFSEKSKVNRTYLSQYINQKLNNPPSPKVLERIAASSNGIVTYNTLMQICGYIKLTKLSKDIFSDYTIITESEWKTFFGENEIVKLSDNESLVWAKLTDKLNYPDEKIDEKWHFDYNLEDYTKYADNNIEKNLIIRLVYFWQFLPAQKFKHKEEYDNIMKIVKNLKPIPLVQKETPYYYMCPVYGQISAGQPNWAEECIEGRLPLDPDLMGIVNPEEHFFLRVNGESMNKVIRNGAFALIHKQDMVEDGEIAVVLVNGYDATLKKFTRQGDMIILEPQSDDDNFKTQVYDKTTPIKILGKYVGKMEINK